MRNAEVGLVCVRTTIRKEAARYGVTELQIDLQPVTARARVRQGFSVEKCRVSFKRCRGVLGQNVFNVK